MRWLVRLFPGTFRQRYGDELIDVLDDRAREARRRLGRLGAARFWWKMLVDLVRTAVAERRSRGRSSRAGKGDGLVAGLAADIHVSWRILRRRPGLPVIVVATLALAIGANTAVYSVVDTVLLSPLPYPDADALVRIHTSSPPNRWPLSMADFLALREQQTSFERVEAFRTWRMTYAAEDAAERLSMLRVTAGFFPLLGVTPVAGRVFTEGDDAPQAPATVVLGDDLWRTRFGGRTDVVGEMLRLDGVDRQVIGVVGRDVGPLTFDADAFVPLSLTPPSRKGPFFMQVLGRVRAEVGVEAANQELREINRRIFPIWEQSYQDQRATWGTESLRRYLVGDTPMTLWVVQGAVLLVLLIACSNIANLLLTRTGDRAGELAVRSALGASRAALGRLMIVESAMMTVAGGAAGVGIAAGAVPLVRWLGAGRLPRMDEVTVDGRVLLMSAVLIAACVMAFGVTPMIGRRGAGDGTLVAARTTEGRATHRLRRALVTLQVAVALPLLFGAGLLARSLSALHRVDPGFDPDGLLTVSVILPSSTYPELGDIVEFWERALPQLRTVSGVEHAALGDGRPPGTTSQWNNFDLETRPTGPEASQPVAPWITVTPAFFDVLDTPLMAGRVLEDTDRGDAPPVVVVDRTWARRLFPDESPIGQRLQSGGCTTCPWTTIVGVVGDVKFAGLNDNQEGTVYAPFPMNPFRGVYLYVRTAGDPAAVWPAIRAELRAIDATLAPTDVATGSDLMRDAVAPAERLAGLVALFAVVAALIAAVGIYGALAHYVQGQMRAIGIRMALGSAPSGIAAFILRRGLILVMLGCAVGAVTALALARGLGGLLYGVTPTDLPALGAAVGILVAAAVLACVAPARRASKVDPVVALRAD
jgi:predicted permease